MVTYNSLFDKVSIEDLKKFYPFEGKLSQVIEELRDDPSTTTLIYHPTRILRALIDYKYLHPENPVIFNIIRYAVELTKEIYSIQTVQQFKLTSLKMMFIQNQMEDLLEFEIVQEEDPAACMSSSGKLTQKTAEKIKSKTGNKPILLIPMAHGGIAPGTDLFLRYAALSENNFSTLYPCRFSVHKQNDATPLLTSQEISYLQKEAKNKSIVVFEENIVTGLTMKNVLQYLKSTVFLEEEIISVSNLDISEVTQVDNNAKKNHEEMLKQFLLQYEDQVV